MGVTVQGLAVAWKSWSKKGKPENKARLLYQDRITRKVLQEIL